MKQRISALKTAASTAPSEQREEQIDRLVNQRDGVENAVSLMKWFLLLLRVCTCPQLSEAGQ